jgi:hypothetical protein
VWTRLLEIDFELSTKRALQDSPPQVGDRRLNLHPAIADLRWRILEGTLC